MKRLVCCLIAIAALVAGSGRTPFVEFVARWGGQTKEAPAAVVLGNGQDAFVAGSTYSMDFPTNTGRGPNGNWCAFATRLVAKTGALAYSMALCTNWMTFGKAAALAPAGELWLAGSTGGTDLPLTADAAQNHFGGASDATGSGDAFLMRLSPDGRGIAYATYLGGSADDSANALLGDLQGGVWVGGKTASSDFPVTPDAPQMKLAGGNNAFLAHLNSRGRLVFATYFGGTDGDEITGIARLDRNRIVLVGNADSEAPSGHARRAGVHGFIAVFDSRSRSMAWRRSMGILGNNHLRSVTVLPGGTIVAVGDSDSAACRNHSGRVDGWIVAVSDRGEPKADYCLGGAQVDQINAVAAAPDGTVWLTGLTSSHDFPFTKDAPRTRLEYDTQAFVAQIQPLRAAIRFATLLGSDAIAQPDISRGHAVAVARDGTVFAAGETTGNAQILPTKGAFRERQPFDSTDVYLVGLRNSW